MELCPHCIVACLHCWPVRFRSRPAYNGHVALPGVASFLHGVRLCTGYDGNPSGISRKAGVKGKETRGSCLMQCCLLYVGCKTEICYELLLLCPASGRVCLSGKMSLSASFSLSVSVCLSVSLVSVCISVLYLWLSLCMHYLSLPPSVFLYVCSALCLCASICLSIWLCLSPSVFLYVCLSLCLSVCLSLSLYLSISLSLSLSLTHSLSLSLTLSLPHVFTYAASKFTPTLLSLPRPRAEVKL